MLNKDVFQVMWSHYGSNHDRRFARCRIMKYSTLLF